MRTLFSEIQSLFERTYTSVGINLEECLVDSHRSRQLTALAGAQARELAETARTFLRTTDDGCLRIGIYYSQWLIEQLERMTTTNDADTELLQLLRFRIFLQRFLVVGDDFNT